MSPIIPCSLKELTNRQHTLGSHTWSHKDLTTLSYDELHDEFWRVEEAFIRILGKKPLYVSLLFPLYSSLFCYQSPSPPLTPSLSSPHTLTLLPT
jgi:peptidoglycan/xylan/chitin deacetylase (PgdA/CDA1 family)